MESILNERNIKYLYHFTRADNLKSIFEEGLLPRSELEKKKLKFILNDLPRYDKCKEANCTSIEFPNYKMFYNLRDPHPEVNWVVLRIDAKSVINKYECAFCHYNAGSSEIYNTSIESRKGKKALFRLYEEVHGMPTREDLGTKKNYPTNPQAEVLVFSTIPQKYIKNVLFEDDYTLQIYKQYIPKQEIALVEMKFFKGREDWQGWKGRRL